MGELAAGLRAFGVPPGARIAVMGDGRDVTMVLRAVTLAGCEVVTIPDHATGARLRIRMKGVTAALAGGPQEQQIRGVAGDLAELRHLWPLTDEGLRELTEAGSGTLPAPFRD